MPYADPVRVLQCGLPIELETPYIFSVFIFSDFRLPTGQRRASVGSAFACRNTGFPSMPSNSSVHWSLPLDGLTLCVTHPALQLGHIVESVLCGYHEIRSETGTTRTFSHRTLTLWYTGPKLSQWDNSSVPISKRCLHINGGGDRTFCPRGGSSGSGSGSA